MLPDIKSWHPSRMKTGLRNRLIGKKSLGYLRYRPSPAGDPYCGRVYRLTLRRGLLNTVKAVHKGGRVVCAGIHMSAIASFPIAFCGKSDSLCLANLTRQDGLDFLHLAPEIGIVTATTRYPLNEANQA